MAISDTTVAPGHAARVAAQGVDFIQLRDKSVAAQTLAQCARSILAEIQSTRARLLVNGRADIALATQADGVHLTAHPDELTPAQVRQLFALRGAPVPFISVSCHTLDEVLRARAAHADLILFGPVFEKRGDDGIQPGQGLEALRAACRAAAPTPVLALGGVTSANAAACVAAGAAGIAAIRLFG